ncbi:MAG: hypothetical protein K2H60_09175 [Muribaculaceae bacterium]|nr:hypothetical protein [Muribaculaceae bacterium]
MDKTKAKETYVKPSSEIVNLELEQPILSGSSIPGGAPDFTDGGTWW